MRLAIVLLLLIATSCFAFAANKSVGKRGGKYRPVIQQQVEVPGCASLSISRAPKVSENTPGYETVHVEFDINTTGLPARQANTTNLMFGIFYVGHDVRQDENEYIKD